MVPDRLNALAGGLEPAQLISSRVMPAPPVLEGPPLAPTVIWRVRYLSDGAAGDVPEDAIRLLPQFQAVMTEMAADLDVPDGDTTPVVRDATWVGRAIDEEAVKRAVRKAWGEKYGPDSPPRGGDTVHITRLPDDD